MSISVKIEGKSLRWFVMGAVVEYLRRVQPTQTLGADFDYLVSDTCHRAHQYLTSHRSEGLDGSTSDLQCTICLQAWDTFVGFDADVEIFW